MTSRTRAVYGGGDDEPASEADDGVMRVRERPENQVPVPVPISLTLARTDDVAVLLTGVQACRTGFTATISVRLRRTPSEHRDLFNQVSGHSPAREALLVGLEYADGRRGSTAERRPFRPSGPSGQGGDRSVWLTSNGGGGGGREYEQNYWVSPLPPQGQLRLIVRWDAQGVAETITEVDGTLIAAAGESSEELWAWEPDEPAPPEPAAAPLPADSWFSR